MTKCSWLSFAVPIVGCLNVMICTHDDMLTNNANAKRKRNKKVESWSELKQERYSSNLPVTFSFFVAHLQPHLFSSPCIAFRCISKVYPQSLHHVLYRKYGSSGLRGERLPSPILARAIAADTFHRSSAPSLSSRSLPTLSQRSVSAVRHL